jgi:hypothetical protein
MAKPKPIVPGMLDPGSPAAAARLSPREVPFEAMMQTPPEQPAQGLPLGGGFGIPRPLSRRLVRAAGPPGNGDGMTVGDLVGTLGDRSFGWCIVLFALINLIPMPLGSMIMSLPLMLVAGQMALGLPKLRLPQAVMRREVGRKRFQKVVMRLRPLFRPIERIIRPRHGIVFTPRNEQVIGLVLFAVAVALFMPFPLSGWLPAVSLLVTGLGLVERDGLVALAGLGLGLFSVALTVAVALALVLGVQFLAA